MVTKSISKDEAKRLRKLEEHTEEWASKAAGSLKLTRDLCRRAAGAACHDSHHMSELDRLMDEATESMLASITYASKFASSKRSAIMNECQKKGSFGRHCKGPPQIQGETHKKLEHAFTDIGMTVFEALQSQARELDKIATKCMEVIGRSSIRVTASKSEPIASLECTGLTSSQELWMADSPANCQTSGSVQDCAIDWDGFESDLKAMSTTVNSCIHDVALSTSATDMIAASHDSMAMMAQLKEAELEKDEALKRAHQAENCLHELERVHHSSLEQFSTFYTEDDILELQRALKKEQMTRVGLEVELRDAKVHARAAEDDSKAARFALTVAQQVAAKMASSSHRRNPSTDSLGKSLSEELPPPPVESNPGITLRPSMSMGDIPQVDNERSVVVAVQLPETDGAKRSDSAFIVRSESLENTVSPTSTTTAQVNEGESNDDSLIASGSMGSNAGLEISTTHGTRETFAEEPREMFSAESPDSLSIAPAEAFLLAPKMIEARSTSSESLEECNEAEEEQTGWCKNSPQKENGWNPFDCQGETHAQSAGNDNVSVQEVEPPSAPTSMEATASSDMREDTSAVEGERKEAWNPFVSKASSVVCSDDRIEVSEPTSEQPVGDSWNPFSSEGKTSPEKGDVNDGMQLNDIPGKNPGKSEQSEGWNPFSAVTPQELEKKGSQNEWNPFSTDADSYAASAKKENNEAVWNPFV
ncbi:hypothetical protein BSKO_06496 [Bryopsis sp. KO-2023]|nr:hypothetical protein BSKO_06496 [Bryopsis sp. KO-2023]